MLMTAPATTPIATSLVEATIDAFALMMDVRCSQSKVSLRRSDTPLHPVTAAVGLNGQIVGTMCLSVPVETALNIVRRMVDVEVAAVDRLVCDSVGEFSNVIAGGAKDKVPEFELVLGVPMVVQGEDQQISFPRNCQPVCVDFESDIGPFQVLFGFVHKVDNTAVDCPVLI